MGTILLGRRSQLGQGSEHSVTFRDWALSRRLRYLHQLCHTELAMGWFMFPEGLERVGSHGPVLWTLPHIKPAQPAGFLRRPEASACFLFNDIS